MNTPPILRGLLVAACLSPSALFAQTFVKLDPGPDVEVIGTSTAKRLPSQAFDLGFNVAWDGVQAWSTNSSGAGELWGGTSIRQPLYDFLRDRGSFAGAIYRYPGGTPSNYFDWTLSVGDSRVPMRFEAESNQTLLPQFGLDEFLKFVEQAKGKAMLTFNMLTVLEVVEPTPGVKTAVYHDVGIDAGRWAIAKSRAIGLLEYCNGLVYTGTANPEPNTDPKYDWNGDGVYQANDRRDNRGVATPYNVMLWEMGNELDTVGAYYFPVVNSDNTVNDDGKQLYAKRAKELMVAMQEVEKRLPGVPAATYIVHAITNPDDPDRPALRWNISSTSSKRVWSTWHDDVMAATASNADALVFHSYYDGVVVPSVISFTNVIWTDSKNRFEGEANALPIHITEHGTWPSGGKPTWPATTSVDGGINNADFILACAHQPWMRSALNHCLSAIGPWAPFSQVDPSTGEYVDNQAFKPRPLSRALTLMHRAFTPQAEVMTTTVRTPIDNANYATGVAWWDGYDARGIVFRHGFTYGAAAISRAWTKDYNLRLTFPDWPTIQPQNLVPNSYLVRQEGVDATAVNNATSDSSIWTRYFPVRVSNSAGYVKMPKRSVTVSTALAPNFTVNGDFIDSAGSLPSGWFAGSESGTTGTITYQTADTTGVAYGNRNIRLKKNNTASGGYMLIQPYKNGTTTIINSDLGPTGVIANNFNDRFILRALVRPSGLANGVKLKVQFYDSSGAGVGNAFSTASSTNSGKWELLALEFIPSQILPAGAAFGSAHLALYNSSPNVGHADFSSVTLEHIPNRLLNPGFLIDSDGNNTPDAWQYRIGTYVTNVNGQNVSTPVGSIQRLSDAGGFYQRLTKSAGQSHHEVSIAQENAGTLAGGTLDKRRGEKWRLRAKVRYNNMKANCIRLRLQFFNQGYAYNASSPSVTLPAVDGSSPDTSGDGIPDTWQDVVVDFIQPRDIIGVGAFEKAEVVLINSSSAPAANCWVDVRSMNLEMLD